MAIVCDDAPTAYGVLYDLAKRWAATLEADGVAPGTAVAITGRLCSSMIALLFALVERRNVIVPFLSAAGLDADEAMEIARVTSVVRFDAQGEGHIAHRSIGEDHPLLASLRGPLHSAGLVLFTSGSTGKSKASVLRMDRMIEKILSRPARPLTSLAFLMFDHIGGMNTLLHALLHGGTAVFVAERTADAVARAIARHGIQVLPTTPTFLNILLVSGAPARHDLSSLELVTYGTEPMLASTLAALNAAMPGVRCKQTYGLTEAGILPTRSEANGSLWMEVGGDGYETRVVDGILWLRTRTAMLGYLNAASPFDEDGWLDTGDRVEVRGNLLRILGRDSEVINVGGEKLYPADVENVILGLPLIEDVLVSGWPSALMGQVVVATVRTRGEYDPATIERIVREHCAASLPAYKVPAVVSVSTEALAGERFKKLRKAPSSLPAAGEVR